MSPRLAFAVVLATVLVASLAVPSASQASPGALRILVVYNQSIDEVVTAIRAQPGVAVADGFDSDVATPTAADLATRDLVVSTGDVFYDDPALWGNRLADYVDAGGAVLQMAYDNHTTAGTSPTGRFASGGYPPLLLGPAANTSVTLGQILVSNHPLLAGLGSFPSESNTTTPLAPGATLLAKWSDGRNAIAVKGRVAATSASGSGGDGLSDIGRLARNAGNFLGRHRLSVTKQGAGSGIVTSSPAGIACGADCLEDVPFDTQVALTATPAAGSAFVGFAGACTGAGPCGFRMLGAAQSVAATFASTARCGNPGAGGTAGSDSLVGTPFGDSLDGLAGNDVLRGLAGRDCLNGRRGNDRLFGDSGGDSLTGGSGRDGLSGGFGGDSLSGGASADRLSGGAANDRLTGGSGNDRLNGERGNDRLTGGSGNDRLGGGSGRDVLVAGKGRNVLNAGSGNDRVNSVNGRRDRVVCGTGRDRVKADEEDRLVGCERVRRV